MPLMTQIMKKCESEAQQKIAEAQKVSKNNRVEYDSENDGGEILHDPKSMETEENGEEVKIDLDREMEENGKTEEKEEVKINPEEIFDQKSNIKELYLNVLKLNKALERVKKYPELLEEVKELKKENKRLKSQGKRNSAPGKKVESILPR